MKKLVMGILLAAAGIGCLQAGNATAPQCAASTPKATAAVAPTPRQESAAIVNDEWDFLQIGFWFDVPSSTINTPVYGIKVGAPFCSGKGPVNGLETAVFCGATDEVNGAQACILSSVTKKAKGLQFSIVNFAETVSGLQLGVVNVARKKGFQIGIFNYLEDGALPFTLVVNWKF